MGRMAHDRTKDKEQNAKLQSRLQKGFYKKDKRHKKNTYQFQNMQHFFKPNLIGYYDLIGH
jgi:hypothetical protein